MIATQPRRQFFRSFVRELIGIAEEVRGRPQLRLDELEALPDATLRDLCPLLSAAYRLDGNRIMEGADEVCALDDLGRFVVGRFDGHRTIAAIARDAAATFSLDAQAALRAVRTIFVALAKPMICIPSNTPGDEP